LKPQLFTAPPLDDRSDANWAHEMTGGDDESIAGHSSA